MFLIYFLDDVGDCQCGVNARRGKDSAAGLDSDINSLLLGPANPKTLEESLGQKIECSLHSVAKSLCRFWQTPPGANLQP